MKKIKTKRISAMICVMLVFTMLFGVGNVFAEESEKIYYLNGDWEFTSADVNVPNSTTNKYTYLLNALIQGENMPVDVSTNLPEELNVLDVQMDSSYLKVTINDALINQEIYMLDFYCGILNYNLNKYFNVNIIKYYDKYENLIQELNLDVNKSLKTKTSSTTFDKLSNEEKNNLTKLANDTNSNLSRYAYSSNANVVVIDPGHGGNDSGAYKPYNGTNYKESNLNLQISLKLKSYLEGQGHTVYMTRSSDEYVDNAERYRIANNYNADAFICIHCNSAGSSANGMWVNYPTRHDTEWSRDLADRVDYTVTQNYQYLSRHRQPSPASDWIVLNGTAMPAIFIETAFMTNSTDMSKLTSSYWQGKIAEGIGAGFRTWSVYGER